MAVIVGPPANATRCRPITTELQELLNGAADATGVDKVVIVSGGQTSNHAPHLKGVPCGWTGSRRHDNGGAADIELIRGGNTLSFTDTNGSQVAGFVTACAARGATGIGAGEHYMGKKKSTSDSEQRPSGAPQAYPRMRRPGCEQPSRKGGTIRPTIILPRLLRSEPPGARSSRHAAGCGCAGGQGSASIARDCSTRERSLGFSALTANGRASIWRAMAASTGMCLRHFSRPPRQATPATPVTTSRSRVTRRLWPGLPRRRGRQAPRPILREGARVLPGPLGGVPKSSKQLASSPDGAKRNPGSTHPLATPPAPRFAACGGSAAPAGRSRCAAVRRFAGRLRDWRGPCPTGRRAC